MSVDAAGTDAAATVLLLCATSPTKSTADTIAIAALTNKGKSQADVVKGGATWTAAVTAIAIAITHTKAGVIRAMRSGRG